ncbi:MAG: hypothetical protein NC926_10305 [Candidatus Omnitrophica bacterium]|nr:hypothetical protein [Candidatus Omnitrophota bacterium]
MFERGKKYVKISKYGGNCGWAREGRGMNDSWTDEDVEFDDVKVFDKLIKEVEKIAKIEDEIDKEAEIREFVDRILDKYYEYGEYGEDDEYDEDDENDEDDGW